MSYENDDRLILLDYLWILKSDFSHCLERRVKTFPDILIWRIGKFIYYPHDFRIASELFIKKILYCNVTRKFPWAVNFYSVIVDADLYVWPMRSTYMTTKFRKL